MAQPAKPGAGPASSHSMKGSWQTSGSLNALALYTRFPALHASQADSHCLRGASALPQVGRRLGLAGAPGAAPSPRPGLFPGAAPGCAARMASAAAAGTGAAARRRPACRAAPRTGAATTSVGWHRSTSCRNIASRHTPSSAPGSCQPVRGLLHPQGHPATSKRSLSSGHAPLGHFQRGPGPHAVAEADVGSLSRWC